MAETKKTSKKKAVTKPSEAKVVKKASKLEFPKPTSRKYGAPVFVKRLSRAEAVRLVTEHGFKLEQDLGDEAVVMADKEAFNSYTEERTAGQ